MKGWGALRDCRYLLHDRDTKFTRSFRAIIAPGRVEPLALPVRSPDLNAYSERWVGSVKEECLSKVLLIGERSLRLALSEYVAHYHAERNHQGKDNVLLFPRDTQTRRGGPVQCRERLGQGCCITIIKKPRNLAEKSRMILWLEVDCMCARTTMLLANIARAVDR
jgi:putative transposase